MSEVFDEEVYLRINPDVAAAVKAGLFESGLAHYRNHGEYEGRLIQPRGFPDLSFSLELMDEVLTGVHERIAAYRTRGVNRDISPLDDMFRPEITNPEQAYFAGGDSAMLVIARALILGRRSSVDTILDLPSGAGRITRHLRAFFPEAKIWVSDINRPLAEVAAANFDAELLEVRPDFSEPPTRQFDLIFVGSLLTHLPEPSFRKALDWFIAATAVDGLLVASVHGRQFSVTAKYLPMRPERWDAVRAEWQETGFGYMETGEYETPYGLSLTQPSWIMRVLEADDRIRILAYEERAWVETQDALILRRV